MESTTVVTEKKEKKELTWNDRIANLAESMEGQEKKEILTQCVLVGNLIRTTDKGEKESRQLTPYEAFALVVTCRQLNLNPLLKHIIPMEGQLYGTYDGYLYSAHKSNRLVSITGSWEVADHQKREYRYKAVVKRMSEDGKFEQTFDGEGIANNTNVRGAQYKSADFFAQMAEARAKRRALRQAFPLGLSFLEDALTDVNYNNPPDAANNVEQASTEDVLRKIEAIKDIEEYQKVMEEISDIMGIFTPDQQTTVIDAAKAKKESLTPTSSPTK